MFSFDDGLPDPSDAIPRRGCDPSLFDHYTTLKNAMGIMSDELGAKKKIAWLAINS